MSKFHWCSDQLPDADGVYKVVRRAFHGRPDREDECIFERVDGKPIWDNLRGTEIQSVIGWYEIGE